MKERETNVTDQFDEIFRLHHDPEERARRKLLKIRDKRIEDIKADIGL